MNRTILPPISSALHLGADKVLLMGAWHIDDEEGRRHRMDTYPTLAQIAGHALDSIFLDGLEVDLERLERMNQTVSLIPEELRSATKMRHVDVLVIPVGGGDALGAIEAAKLVNAVEPSIVVPARFGSGGGVEYDSVGKFAQEMGLAEGAWEAQPRLVLTGSTGETDETRVVFLEARAG